MKGISLPINSIIIIAIGIIVLLALIGFFTHQFSNASSSMQTTAEFEKMCSVWRMVDCNQTYYRSSTFTINGKTIQTICKEYVADNADICAKACGC